MSNITGDGESLSSENYTDGGGGGGGGGGEEVQQQHPHGSSQPPLSPVKKKRNLPGTPDPTAEVIALSPSTLMATNRFVCEICNKGFQRDQNLQLHRRGHNLPWKLRQRAATAEVRKRVYICPEPSCLHHNPSRALGDLTGIKKHFCRKHGEKRWKCDKCPKRYAVQSDWKAHSKTCGTREYKCDCGTIFSRRDSFITHRAFCDALAEESNKPTAGNHAPSGLQLPAIPASAANAAAAMGPEISSSLSVFSLPSSSLHLSPSSAGPATADGMRSMVSAAAHMSATALLQKAAQMGATASGAATCMAGSDMRAYNPAAAYDGDGLGMMDGGNGYVNGGHRHGHGHGHGQFFDGQGAVEQGRFLKSLEQDMHARSSSNSVMTVDFMGVGRMPRPVPAGLQHQFQQQQQQQQQLSAHGQSNGSVLMDKSMWGDV